MDFNVKNGVLTEYTGSERNVTVPENVREIGDSVFMEKNLESVVVGKNVRRIGKQAFMSCKKLRSVTLPMEVTEIGDMAFACCPSLKEITIPKMLKKISPNLFLECSGLETVTFPDKDQDLTEIGAQAFMNCERITKIRIPNNVETIGNSAFWACHSLKEVTFPIFFRKIESYAFCGCKQLETVDDFAVSVIEKYAFFECMSLKRVYIPKETEEIGELAFGYLPGKEVGKVKGFTIVGARGSEAERYAKENGFTFKNEKGLLSFLTGGRR